MLYKDKIEQTTFNLPQSLTTDFLIRNTKIALPKTQPGNKWVILITFRF